MQLFIWRHFQIQLPDDWEMLLFGRDLQAGRCTFADRYQYRLELNWRVVPGPPDFDRLTRDYRSELEGDETAQEVQSAQVGAWTGLALRLGGVLTSRFGCYFPEEQCLVELVFVWPVKRDRRLERDVLDSVCVEPVREDGLRRWKAFGMDMLVTDALPLTKGVVQPANVRLIFGDIKELQREETFERLGMVPLWLKTPVRDWLRKRVPRGIAVRAQQTESHRACEVEVLEGDRLVQGPMRMIGRRLAYRARAWICPTDDRLYCQTIIEPKRRAEEPAPVQRLRCADGAECSS